MHGNTIGSFTRYRESQNGSQYRQVLGHVVKSLRFAHSNAGKTTEGLPLRRHLIGVDMDVLPTATNGLAKPEKVTVNFTVTHTDGVPLAAGAAGTTFENASIILAIFELAKVAINSAQSTNTTGLVTPAQIRDGEI